MNQDSDIKELNASFHLRALLPRVRLKCPMGVPVWGSRENRAIFKELSQGANTTSGEKAVSKIENRIRELFGVKYCITTTSGRHAIKLALLSLGLRIGDGVILPDYTCLSVLTPVLELGLKPVFADIGDDLHIDPESVKRVIRPQTKALIVPHLFGALAPMDQLLQIAKQNSLYLIDDAAQAIGLKGSWGYVGTGGDAGIYSFGPFKPMSAMQGGAFVTNNTILYERARDLLRRSPVSVNPKARVLKSFLKMKLRKYSYVFFLLRRQIQQRQETSSISVPQRNKIVNGISTLDAHLIDSQIEGLKDLWERTWPMTKALYAGLCDIPFLKPCIQWPYSGYPRCVVRIETKSNPRIVADFFSYMIAKGVEVQPGYRPLHYFMRDCNLSVEGEFQKTEAIYNKILCLPFPDKENLPYLLNCIKRFAIMS